MSRYKCGMRNTRRMKSGGLKLTRLAPRGLLLAFYDSPAGRRRYTRTLNPRIVCIWAAFFARRLWAPWRAPRAFRLHLLPAPNAVEQGGPPAVHAGQRRRAARGVQTRRLRSREGVPPARSEEGTPAQGRPAPPCDGAGAPRSRAGNRLTRAARCDITCGLPDSALAPAGPIPGELALPLSVNGAPTET